MPERVTGKQAANVGAPRTVYAIGLLMPVEIDYWKWYDKDASGNRIEGSGGVVPYAQWVRLPKNKQGQKWYVTIDQRVFRPDFEKLTTRNVMVDFDDWNRFYQPSIMDMVGEGHQSFSVFIDRSNEENWYVEAELAHSGYYTNKDGEEKPQNQFKFIRMTQDKTLAQKWHDERYPREELVIPDESLERAKMIYQKMTKGTDQERADKFNTIVNGDDELSIYLLQFAANDYALVK